MKNKLQPNRQNLKRNPYQSSVNSRYPNAYSVDEIKQMIKNEKKNGGWDRRLNEFKNKKSGGSGIFHK